MSNENRDYYLRNGRCPRCGGKHPLMPGKRSCRECALKASDRRREIRAFRRENGLCTRCGKPLPEGSAYLLCDDCRAYQRSFQSFNERRYEGLKNQGKCVRCGSWAEPGKTLCRKCAAEQARYDARRSEAYSARKKQRRQARIEAGLCIDCGLPADEGHTRCPACRARRMDSSRKYKIIKRINKEAEAARRRSVR